MPDNEPAGDVEREVFRLITALDPRQAVYDKWVKLMSAHMPEDEAKAIAADLVDEAFDEAEGG